MVVKVKSAVPFGVSAVSIEVEVDINSRGLPGFTIVGLPSKAVDEARERVRAAIKNAGFEFVNKKITVNLAPADLPKEGTVLDLPIAVAILALSEQIPMELVRDKVFYGELSLSGELRRSFGSVLAASLVAQSGNLGLVLPKANEREAQLIAGLVYWPIENLAELKNMNEGQIASGMTEIGGELEYGLNFEDVRGQLVAKRAMIVAAAGGHNLLMSGSPGVGKTMLSRALISVLPQLTPQEYLEVVSIYSAAAMIEELKGMQRPFRSPHHTLSGVGLIGGGAKPKPGEISLAHKGVLFLDELPLFARSSLEALRQPMEDKRVSIVRANFKIVLPSDFMLIAAVNPCPCGYMNHPIKKCSCTPLSIDRYRQKISGPVMDRIDMVVKMSDREAGKLQPAELNSVNARSVIKEARDLQYKRNGFVTNSGMTNKQVERLCELDDKSKKITEDKVGSGEWSLRTLFRVLKVARTIADLDSSKQIEMAHLSEASMYRMPEW